MIHTIKIDGDVEERLKEFNAKLPPDQKIVMMTTSETYLFVTTEKKALARNDHNMGIGMQLLHDHLQRGPK